MYFIKNINRISSNNIQIFLCTLISSSFEKNRHSLFNILSVGPINGATAGQSTWLAAAPENAQIKSCSLNSTGLFYQYSVAYFI